MSKFLIFLIIFSAEAFAQRDLCDLIELANCDMITRGSRRSSLQSLPGSATSASLNPATVSFDKGFGVEVIHLDGNPLQFSLAGGTGKVGAALISTSVENGFFGNRTVELDGVYGRRNDRKKIYRSEKLTLAGAFKLFRRKSFSLDLGLIAKRHSEIKKINPGAGLSASLGPLTLGASVYQDDFQLKLTDFISYPIGTPYDLVFTDDTYEERFTVTTYTAGLRFWACSIDGGILRTKYKEYRDPSTVQLIAASCIYRRFRAMIATRRDESNALKFVNNELTDDEKQTSTFWGAQASVGKHFIFGVSYNYFLLREISLNGTVFF